MLASQNGRVEIVRLLLDAGADKNLLDCDGFTALMLASDRGHHEVVRLLLEAGADEGLTNCFGRTALMPASQAGRVEIVRLLLDAGADKNLLDCDGFTALMLAIVAAVGCQHQGCESVTVEQVLVGTGVQQQPHDFNAAVLRCQH